MRLVHEYPTEPYRSGRVQVLQDPPIDAARGQVGELMKTLKTGTARLARLLPPVGEVVQAAWAAHPHPLVVANHLASGLVIDAYDRQGILEQDDPVRRDSARRDPDPGDPASALCAPGSRTARGRRDI